jgi:predicted AAA+ superfamily ATPase
MLREHISENRQMAFVSGPRQVGKTTTCRQLGDRYFSWDATDHSLLFVKGQDAIAEAAKLKVIHDKPPILIFDELHKYPRWKSFLKGFFDVYERDCRVVVTGSSRLDTYRRGGDSLMGRYFLFRMHPLSIAELLSTQLPDETLLRSPAFLDDAQWEALNRFGGFPEPFAAATDRFSRRWQSLRHAQLLKEDARDLTRIQELPLLEVMAKILQSRSSQQLIYANLAKDVTIAPNTARSWVDVLCSLHYGFLVKPWSKNVTSALRKEPKWFLRDWSGITDEGQRFETLMACHLLKATDGWTDLGYGQFELRYIRDKQKREIDFVITRDSKPWILVEAKLRDTRLSPALPHFQQLTGAAHAFQVVMHMPFVNANPFDRKGPLIVPARTFLSQLL